ncbi:MAG: hypothetical protein LBM12_01795 [Candidatus Nomurabacteria bacterium]|jgi:hypothetical protein|nr:hypothetical protein [Candidatus Nomurabacteria bacterium]
MARLFKWRFAEAVAPKKGYGGIYGAEAAGKGFGASKMIKPERAAGDFADAEKSATARGQENTESADGQRTNSRATSESTDAAENGGAVHTPRYGGAADKNAVAAAASAARGDVLGALKNAYKSRTSNNDGSSKKPLIATGIVTALVALFFGSVSSLLPVHLLENLTDLKNSLQTTNFQRGNKLVRATAKANKYKADPDNLFAKRTGVSKKRAAQMNKGFEGTGLKFEVDPETNKYVLMNDDGTRIADDDALRARFESDADFRTKWNEGAKIITGSTGGWYKSAMADVLRNNFLTRNLFKNFIAEQDAAEATRAAQSKIAENSDQLKARATEANYDDVTDKTDDKGNVITDDEGNVQKNARTSVEQGGGKAQIIATINAKAKAIASGVGGTANLVCGVTIAIAAVSATYAIAQAMEGLVVVSSWFEAGQKMMVGTDEDDDSYHAFGDMLNTATVTTTFEGDEEIELHDGEKLTATESMGAQAILVGGIAANIGAEDPSVGKFSMEGMTAGINIAGGSLKACIAAQFVSAAVNVGILVAEMVLAVFTGGVSAIGKVLVDELGGVLFGVLTSVAVSMAISGIASVIASIFVKKLAIDVFGEDFGNLLVSYGTRYYNKAHQGNGGVALSFDSALAFYKEQQTVLAYNAEVDRATHSPFDITNNNTFLGKLAGNLAVATSGRGSSVLGQIGTLGSFASAMKAPITLNASAATELEFREQINWDSSLGDDGNMCVGLSTIGAVGDMFCNPLRGSDFSTVETDPEEIFWKVAYTCTKYGNIPQAVGQCSFAGKQGVVSYAEYALAQERGDPFAESDAGKYYAFVFDTDPDTGLEVVNQNSDLARMIKWGVNRKSDPGTTDINIMQEGQVSTSATWLDSLLGAIPIVGDVIDIASAVGQNEIYESGWADGSAFCVGCDSAAGGEGEWNEGYSGNTKWNSVYKYLDQYIIDNNLYENMEAIDTSPVSAYIDDVLWPEMDKSYEGVLAANMGVPKEWVVSSLAYANDLKVAPREAEELVASAPNIYATYYGGLNYDTLEVPERDDSYGVLALRTAKETTKVAGVEWRRRFNAEATA